MYQANRRQFLQAGGVAALSVCGGTRGAISAETSKLTQIIDTHTHFYDPTRKEGVPWPGKKDDVLYRKVMPADFIKVAGPYGVTGTVVVEASPWLEDNQWLLDLAEANPVVLGVVGNLKVAAASFQGQLKRFAKSPLYKGLRINTPFERLGDQQQFLADMQAFAATGLIVDVNGGANGMSDILELKKKIPELRVVIEHLPKAPSKDSEQQKKDIDAITELAALPDVYAKVSYVLKAGIPNVSLKLEDYREELDHIWKIFGPDKVFYGSNWPVSDHVCPYGTIIGVMQKYMAGRSQEEAEKYFWKNAQTAYKLKIAAK